MGKFSTFINRYFPYLGMVFINQPSAKYRMRNRLEKKIVEGDSLPQKTGNQSVVFFSCHKAGSSVGLKFLKLLAKENNLKHINYDGYITSVCLEKETLFNKSEFLDRAFYNKGYFFGCFRTFRNIPKIENYKIVLMLRDPRDVLVSHYYWVQNMNVIYNKRGISNRKTAKSSTIDDYVLIVLERFKTTYQEYIDNLIGKKNVMFTKYENFLKDPKEWLKQVSIHTGLESSNELMIRIGEGVKSRNDNKGEKKHHRKAQPGEHKLKLKEETIEKLNKELKEILIKLDYQL